jgi:hypothetical protein
VRRLAFLVLVLPLASCDLQPPKRDAPKPVAAPPPAPAPAPTPPPTKIQEPAVPAPAGSGSAAAGSAAGSGSAVKAAASDVCVEVGAHIANVVIDSIEDASVKAAQEQDRTRLVRRVAETCTRDNWSETARKCFLAGKTAQALEDCGRTLAAP